MTTDPGAPRTDELARNAALHALAGAIQTEGYDAFGMGRDADPERVASGVLDQHTVTWETDVNSAGVPVRRYVLRGAWEVDPAPRPATIPPPWEAQGFAGPHEWAAAGGHDPNLRSHGSHAEVTVTPGLLHGIAETYGPHPFVRQSYKGRQIDACAHFTRISSHEASICGASADDPVHAQCGAELDPGSDARTCRLMTGHDGPHWAGYSSLV